MHKMNGDSYQELIYRYISHISLYLFQNTWKYPNILHIFFGISLQTLKAEFGLVVVYTRFMVINLSGKSRMVFSVQANIHLVFCNLNIKSLSSKFSRKVLMLVCDVSVNSFNIYIKIYLNHFQITHKSMALPILKII